MYPILLPFGDHNKQQIELSPSASRNFRACAPSESINQISLSPSRLLLVPKEIWEPSGDRP
jgi:hypothetical protein